MISNRSGEGMPEDAPPFRVQVVAACTGEVSIDSDDVRASLRDAPRLSSSKDAEDMQRY